MIRFIDLRYQGTGNRFAFWNTVYSAFEKNNDDEAWIDWDDFTESYAIASRIYPLDRYRGLCPSWVFEPPTDEELGFREEGRGMTETDRLRRFFEEKYAGRAQREDHMTASLRLPAIFLSGLACGVWFAVNHDEPWLSIPVVLLAAGLWTYFERRYVVLDKSRASSETKTPPG